jgi:tripartite-type tricarboxylate transporter receptor subunit TctC
MKQWIAALLGVAFAAPLAAPAHAADPWPTKPLRMIVPGAAGTSPDILARIIAKGLTPRLGQTIVIVNQPGGGGNIAHEAVAKSAPDGYTLLVTSDQLSINESLFKSLPFNAVSSFAPVVQAIVSPQVLVVTPSFPAKTVTELVDYAKKNPGKVNFGSPQIGTVGHLAGELLKSTQKIDIVHIPFQGATAALKAVVAGEIQMLFVTLPPAVGQIQSGAVRALAVTTGTRSPAAPNIPTMKEQGYPEFDFGAWQGVLLPAGTPPDLVAKLNGEINAVLKEPETRDALIKVGFTPVGGTPAEFRTLISESIDKWGKLVREVGIKPE